MELRDENFKDLIKEGVVLVDFYATWCGPCKMQGEVLKKLEEDVKIVKIDVDEHTELAKEFGVMSIPTLILFKDDEAVNKNIGFTPESVIRGWL